MHGGVTVDTAQFSAEPIVLGAVSGRYTVTLETYPVTGLIEQPIIRRAVRSVALDTATALDQVIIDNGMLIQVRSRKVGMASLARPIKANSELAVFYVIEIMAVGAPDVP